MPSVFLKLSKVSRILIPAQKHGFRGLQSYELINKTESKQRINQLGIITYQGCHSRSGWLQSPLLKVPVSLVSLQFPNATAINLHFFVR